MTKPSQQRAAAILKVVRGIKRGTFASYGEVARRAGLPGRARLVGTVLRDSGDVKSLPWHRVTGAGGRIAFPAGSRPAREQIRRLDREGVKARGNRVVQKPSASSSRTLDALLWKLRGPMPDRYVVFSHGKDAGPWGVKITALAGNARSEGYEVESVDYRGIDDPRERVNKLVEFCKELKGDLVLCGSSLGGYVSVAAASLLHARGVFLMAPALTMPGLPPLREKLLDCPTTIVHGWKDDVVPVEHSIEFARRHGCALHILNSDHRLQDEVRFLKYLFEYFLISLDLPPDAS